MGKIFNNKYYERVLYLVCFLIAPSVAAYTVLGSTLQIRGVIQFVNLSVEDRLIISICIALFIFGLMLVKYYKK